MTGLRFSSFGASTMPLSKIVIDKELDMGTYPIKAQYRPEEWTTEELGWGDVPASPAVYPEDIVIVPGSTTDHPVMSWTAPAGASYRWTLNLVSHASGANMTATIKVNGTVSETFQISKGATVNKVLNLPSGAAAAVTASNSTGTAGGFTTASYYQCTGVVIGPKTFDLSGKWLALGLDMQGLAATIKVQGVEMPYSDYVKAFPLAPSELTFPGGWDASQERPIVRVYK